MPTFSSLAQRLVDFWNGPDLVHIQVRRERRMLLIGSSAMTVIGLVWAALFIALRNWPLVALDAVLVIGGLATSMLVWRQRVKTATVLIFAVLFTVICTIAAVFDAATPQSPRTSHLYLLPLSVAALMAFRTAGLWLRHGIALTILAAFALLSLSHATPMPLYVLPESIRIPGAWIQTTAALLILYAMLQVLRHDVVIRSTLESHLRDALQQQQFLLHYQPQLDLQNRVIGAEALVRWQHPQKGLLMPGEFIEVAEQSDLILKLGDWVLNQACAQLHSWASQGECQHLRLAVNISQVQFRQADFVAQVLKTIDRHAIDASLLELEITESMLARDLPDIIQKMSALRARGVTFSLDDFGTGYSSLNYLKRLPLNQLKIDQSFVRDVLNNPHDASIAKTIVALGLNLGLTVIAEGVETEAQRDYLAQSGCGLFQGYWFSRALPVDAFRAFVRAAAEAKS
jgi:EAL domain-containing protein (putative c-di-GMP-specific phosphodiesterase class I)